MIKEKKMKETFAIIGNMRTNGEYFLVTFELESEQAKTVADLKYLARKAAKKYAMTDEGQGAYAVNGYSFTWVNFIVEMDDKLSKICRDLGLKVTSIHVIPLREQCLDGNEQLMEDISIDISNIDWDTDDEEVDDLPSEVTLDLRDPSVDIADALSDEYGFCVKSYFVEGVF